MDEGLGTRMQVLGLCRFSVPSLGGFQVEHVTLEARRAMLYDPARLDLRTVWFEHVTLPSIRAQRDGNFTFVVMVGEDLPDPWRSRLERMVADVPQVCIVAAPPGQHRRICADAVRAHVDPGADCVAEFRLDDDDAVAVDFVERVRADAAALIPAFLKAGNAALDYSRGVVLELGPEGVVVTPRRALLWTPALAVLTKADAEQRILDHPHHKLWRNMPTLTLPDEVMFLRGSHGGNDSHIPKEPPAWDLPRERWAPLLKRRFGIDLAGFEAALAGLR